MTPTKDKYLIDISGATAIGKTDLAIALAQEFQTEIISCDSRQFYKEMPIGTAAPSKEQLTAVKHHLIGQISVMESYSVGDFQKDALRVLEELFKKYQVVIMVGGSGLYRESVLRGLDYFPPVKPSIRENLNQIHKEQGLESLQKMLNSLDKLYCHQVDMSNPRRLIRALEICLSSGKPYSSFLGKASKSNDFNSISIGLTAQRNFIYERINQRVDKMMCDGLETETKGLLDFRHLNALQTVGYREMFSYFDGTYDLSHAVEEIKKNTRRFAKRQITWFSKKSEIVWFNFGTPFEKIRTAIKQSILSPKNIS